MEHKLRVLIGKFEVELCGSEEFVAKYEEKFSLTKKLQELPDKIPAAQLKTTQTDSTSTEDPTDGKYKYVFDYSGEKAKLLVNTKSLGKKKSDKQVNVVLLFLLGESLRGVKKVSNKELRSACKAHRCLDGNFSANIKKRKEWFSTDGTKGSAIQEIQLTTLGKEHAEELANEITRKINNEKHKKST